MSKVPVVHLNTGYVRWFLAKSCISGTEFSRSLGYSDHWWSTVLHQKKGVKPNVAKLMCSMYNLDYDKLVVKEPEPVSKPETLTVEALCECLERVEGKLDKLLNMWG